MGGSFVWTLLGCGDQRTRAGYAQSPNNKRRLTAKRVSSHSYPCPSSWFSPSTMAPALNPCRLSRLRTCASQGQGGWLEGRQEEKFGA